MDNELQVEEIKKFHSDLTRQGQSVDENQAARLWIERNAEIWRSAHRDNISDGMSAEDKKN